VSAPTLPITAIVASRNEAKLLARCLEAMSFCDERIVIDLESTDGTREVARAEGAVVIEHAVVPIAEHARGVAIAAARHDWLLVRDPDEIVPPALADEIVRLFPELGDDVAVVVAPTQRYFRGKPIRGGVWGGIQVDRLLANRRLVDFPTDVHPRLVRAPGTRDVAVPSTGDNAIAHYWSDGYRSLIEKHRRYLLLEGVKRVDAGEVSGLRAVAVAPIRAFVDSFVVKRGYRDGLEGLGLSLVWAWYRWGTELSVLRELRRRRAD
jgi:glycosyltransferase involved in cell wall biosynthesis